MADEPRMFTEDEHLAVLTDRVSKETAELTSERDGLKTERDDLATKLDVETAAKTAAETRAQAAEDALAAFKQEIADREAAASRKDERVKALKEAAPHLGDAYFEDEARIQRICAMDDEHFAAHAADLGATKPEGFVAPAAAPRETAMQGDPAGGKPTQSAASTVLLGRFGGGLTKEA